MQLPSEATQEISIADVAVDALAEAMANRLDPLGDAPPTSEITQRASEIVRGVLDLGGRSFAVLVAGSEQDAKRLAVACGKDGDDSLREAFQALDRLMEI
jgi:hypothetical protein